MPGDMKNIFFEERNLRAIFFISIFIALLFMLMNALLVYPSYMNLIKERTADESGRVALHLSKDVIHKGMVKADSTAYGELASEITRDFNILKIKVFSATGEVLFSTDHGDIGSMNTKPYFKDKVAMGQDYSKLVKKSAKTLEGQSFDRHVVETYVPLMRGGIFIGAFEIYYDVTPSVEQMKHTMLMTNAMPALVMVAFVLVIGGLLQKVDRGIESVREAERELIKYSDSLEEQVKVRTAALVEANEELEKEMAERSITDRALKESENFMGFIFESINDPFCIFDRDLTIIRANKGYAKLKGRSINTLTGNQCFRVLEGNEEKCDKCVVSKTFDTRTSETKQKQVDLPSGDTAWVEIITYPIFDSADNVKYVLEYTCNITQRREAEEEKQRLIRELETLSRTDALTGMLNRRAVHEELEREFWRAKRYGHPISVIVCDVDFFKSVNDTFGHAAGDSALVRVAGAICSVLRQSDIAGRYGGDEFLVVLPETTSSGSMDTSERLRMEVSSVKRAPGGQIITMSLGVAAIKSSDETPSDLLKRADSALYASKEGGRNRATLAGLADPAKEDGSAHKGTTEL